MTRGKSLQFRNGEEAKIAVSITEQRNTFKGKNDVRNSLIKKAGDAGGSSGIRTDSFESLGKYEDIPLNKALTKQVIQSVLHQHKKSD